MNRKFVKPVPADFPTTGNELGAVSGVQPKLLARAIDGKFVVGLTAEELYARFDNCSDLVEQLTAYCIRKLAEQPGRPVEELLLQVRLAAESKGWDVSPAELDWIMSKLALQLDDRSR